MIWAYSEYYLFATLFPLFKFWMLNRPVADLLELPGEVFVTDTTVEGGMPESPVLEIPVTFPMMAPEMPVEYAPRSEEPIIFFDAPKMVSRVGPQISPIFEEEQQPVGFKDLSTLKKESKLSEIHVDDLIQQATTSALKHDNGELYHDVESFTDCLNMLYEHGRILPPNEELIKHLFDSLDHAGEGKVDLVEVTAGLVLYAGGSEEDKVEAVFGTVDRDRNGYLSLEELIRFFRLIFQNVFSQEVRGAMASSGVHASSPDELAVKTAVECMEMCDLNKDGKLSLSEFKSWFSNPKQAPLF